MAKNQSTYDGGAAIPNSSLFSCCNSPLLNFLKCPYCSLIMCYCDNCESLFPNLRNCAQTSATNNGSFDCPHCHYEFNGESCWQIPGAKVYLRDMANASFDHLLGTRE